MARKLRSDKETTLAKRIGHNIRRLRTRLGLTQSVVAETIGVEDLTISRIETGYQLPSVDRLDDIAAVLQVPLPILLSDDQADDNYAALLTEAVKDLPRREKEFLFAFAVQYAQHWRAGKRKTVAK